MAAKEINCHVYHPILIHRFRLLFLDTLHAREIGLFLFVRFYVYVADSVSVCVCVVK